MNSMYRILVIDDCFSKRQKAYKTFFAAKYFELHHVSSYKEFNELNQTRGFDAIVLDVFLDDKDWTNESVNIFRESLKSRYSHLPIFIISNRWGDTDILTEMTKLTQIFGRNVADYLSYQEIEKYIQSDNLSGIQQLRLRFIDKLRVNRQEATGIVKEPDEDITILLFSDIQFDDPHTVDSAVGLLGSINAYLRTNEVYPDFIVITGDISFSGSKSEYETALNEINLFIANLWEHMNDELRRQRIILVPGNHDVNLRLSACGNIAFSPNQKSIRIIGDLTTKENNQHYVTCKSYQQEYSDYGLRPFRDFAYKLTRDRRWLEDETLDWIDHRFEHIGLRFINVNTVQNLTTESPKKATVNIEKFSYMDANENTFDILLSHHGNNSEELDETYRQSIKANLLKTLNVNLWLWGHHHEYEFDEFYSPNRHESYPTLYTLQIPSTHQRAHKNQDRKRGFVILDLARGNNKVIKLTSRYIRTISGELPSESEKVSKDID